MKRREALATALVLIMMAGGLVMVGTSFANGEGNLESLAKAFAKDGDVQAFVDGSEGAVNQDLDRDHLFIQLYGGVERLVGRRVVEDAVSDNTVVKLSTGALNFVNPGSTSEPATSAESNAAAFSWLSEELEEAGIPSMFVVAPQKIQQGEDLLPAGVEESGNETADVLLAQLRENGTAALDLRPLFAREGEYPDWFFRTDHHWKPEAAFRAWRELATEFEARYGFKTEESLLDDNNWDTEVLENFFLGSQGKRTGSLYAGVDNFTIYTPLFETDLTYESEHGGFSRTGSFNESVCFPERIAEADWFDGNPYTYYSGGDYATARITNHENPDGPKVVLIRESFSNVLAPFLALSCSELVTVDLRYFTGDLVGSIEQEDPDLVMALYTSSSTGSEQLFQFGQP